MTTLVAGATGATGKHAVEQLLKMGHNVKVIVRPASKFPDSWNNHAQISIIRDHISEMTVEDLSQHIKDCQAVVSCLGHNLTLKGIFGRPRKLVYNAVKLICSAIQENSQEKPVKFVLMNSVGVRNKNLKEPISFAQKMVIALVRLLVPPQSDNEKAANFLRKNIGQNNPYIQWVIVRPDSLINQEEVTPYKTHPSPTRSAIFNPGKTSRINVGNFMGRLLSDQKLWDEWTGRMPVVYNCEEHNVK